MNDLSDLREESVSIQTSAGALRLFPQRFEDIGPFSKLPLDDPPVRRLRSYLPYIATHDADPVPDRQRDAIDEAFCQRLTDDDVERIAEVYLSVPAVRRAEEDAAMRPGMVPRADAETSSHYLDRVLRAEHERQMEDLGTTYTTLRERYGAPLSNALGDLDKQAAQLKEASTTFIEQHDLTGGERVPAETRSIQFASIANEAAIANEGAEQARRVGGHTTSSGAAEPGPMARASEREGEIELTRSIGWMTAQSANLLARLSESATQFLRQFADTAASSDVATRRMLRAALAGIVVAALLAAVALGVALMTFMDQRERQQAEARWQSSVAQTLKDNAATADDRFKTVNAQLRQLTERQREAALPIPVSAAVPPAETKEAATTPAAHREAHPAAPARASKRKPPSSRP